MKAYIVLFICFMLLNSHVDASVQANLLKGRVYGNKVSTLEDARSYIVALGLGFVKGLQADPDQPEPQCQRDILKVGNIYDDLMRLIDQIKKKGFNFLEAMAFINSTYRTLADIEDDCHLLGLLSKIKALLNPVALILKIIEVIFKSYIIVPAFLRLIWDLVWLNDPEGVGFEIGFIFQTIFDYSIKIIQ